MRRRLTVFSLSAILMAAAACSTDTVVSPTVVATRASVVAATATTPSGTYVVLMRSGFPKDFSASVEALGGKVRYMHGASGFAAVSGLTADAAASVAAMAGVSEVQADVMVSLDAPRPAAHVDASDVGGPSASSANNPTTALRYSWQWNMRLINADKAWAAGQLGSPDVKVAILDTGMDYDGVDLNGRVKLDESVSFMNEWVGDETAGDVRTPSDDDLVRSLYPTRNLITDLNGHGTNVASQVSSNADRLAGVTSRTTLLGVKVLGQNGQGSFSQIFSGILYAADHGADVANMSLGGAFAKTGAGTLVSFINRVFNYANARGMLIVVAAGNETWDIQHNGNAYAAFCDAPHVICVSSIGPTTVDGNPNLPAFYSNFGRSAVSVAAPGGNLDADHFPTFSAWPWGNDFASWVWSRCSRQELVLVVPTKHKRAGAQLVPDGCGVVFNYNGYIGTSQASPHVTGLAALLVAKYGHGQPQTIKNIIQASSVDIGAPTYGGRIDVQRALGL